jgi:hypothetical protein
MKKLFLILFVLLTIPVSVGGNGLQTNYQYTAAGTPTSIKALNGSSASYANNNPMMYTDPSGEYAFLDDVIAAAIGGVINLVVNAVQGNLGGHGLWGGIGRGAAAFGAGAAGGWGALYPEFGGWAWGGAAVGATNSWLSGAKGWDIAIGAGVGAVSGVAGGAAGQWGGKYLGGVIINGTKITSPVLQGAVSGAAGGFTAGLIMTAILEMQTVLVGKALHLVHLSVASVVPFPLTNMLMIKVLIRGRGKYLPLRRERLLLMEEKLSLKVRNIQIKFSAK